MGADLPVIAVTRCSRLDDYLASLEAAGAQPRVLDVHESAAAALQGVDGLVLTGGADVDPAIYGEERHPATRDAEPGRDAFELGLVREAMALDLPLLAICRGAQVLNVAAGGTLIQDIPTERPTGLRHAVAEPKDFECHDVAIEPGSRLSRLLGPDVERTSRCRVNSRHHQAVGRLGDGLLVSATAGDGIVEAIESPSARFCIGVQWHPENFWRTGRFRPLFEAFAAAAGSRRIAGRT